MSSITQIRRTIRQNRPNQVQWFDEPQLSDRKGYCYYPGGWRDWSPINRYADEDLFDFFVYADYLVSMNDVIDSLTNELYGFQIIDTTELGPGTCGGRLCDWADYYEQAADWGNPNNGYLLRVRLLTPAGRNITLFYFGTEAIGTLRVLSSSVGRPLLVVVQDHGLGGFWTPFGGPSLLYQALAGNNAQLQNHRIMRHFLPRFIYVAEGTEAWPSYFECSDLEEQSHAMHDVPKRLFKFRVEL